MRRLPDRRMLPFLLETHQVTSGMMGDLAEVLARFHTQAERIMWTDASGHPKAVARQWSANFDDFGSLVGTSIEAEVVDLLKDFGVRFIDRHHDLLMQRARDGWIRDVHGDLHCEHVCFAPEGIEIFDCIEFSPAIRRCDLASEMAFLLMDLEVRGGGFAVQPLLTRYRELLEDAEMAVLLPFYQSYRAVVRAKVHALRAGGMDREAERYLRFALRFTWDPMKPFVLMICGLTGSGKSTLARELGERLGMPVINSDAVRKGMAARAGRQVVPFNEGIYTRARTEKTYAKLARDAESAILSGSGAILDATFGEKAHRGKIVRLAAKHRVPLFVIHCVAPEETTRKRLAERALAGKDISDGRWEIYRQQAAAYQAMDEIPPDHSLELNTEPALEELARVSERFLRSRRAPGSST
jgi:predicted kinase